VAKGTRGGDIQHTVRSPRGIVCGTMIWELKRTKNWTDSWIPKLKEDVRAAKASVPIIVTEAMPKTGEQDIGFVDGVYLCKPQLAVMLGTLLRKSLLDVARQKAWTNPAPPTPRPCTTLSPATSSCSKSK
jgi:hypothetical protein